MSICVPHKYFPNLFILRGLFLDLYPWLQAWSFQMPDHPAKTLATVCWSVRIFIYGQFSISDKEHSLMYWPKFCPLRFTFTTVHIGLWCCSHLFQVVAAKYAEPSVHQSQGFSSTSTSYGVLCEAISVEWEGGIKTRVVGIIEGWVPCLFSLSKTGLLDFLKTDLL